MGQKLALGALLAAGLAAAAAPAARAEDGIRDSVVKIFTVSQKPDYYQPWQNLSEESSSGSGVVIAGGRILTNAHVVSDAVFIQVRRADGEKKYDATVEFVAHDSDLATLKVADPEFFKGARPLSVGQLPHQRDKVAIYGFPAGGDELSITEGTISRLEMIPYAQSNLRFLALQTDAAINPGNSGGPMIIGGKIVGISFQTAGGLQNVGYGVPAPMIRRFLVDISDGHYDGVPITGLSWQVMENESLRRAHGMDARQTGTRVDWVVDGCMCEGKIQTGDILLSVDGHRLANDGTYALGPDARAGFIHLVALHQKGDVVQFGVLRGGKTLRVPVPASSCRQMLVPGPLYDTRPDYFIYGGFVFTTVTRNFVSIWNPNEAPIELRYWQDMVYVSHDRRELVILDFILPHPVNAGYQDYKYLLVESVNGRKIGSMKDLVEAFAHPQNGSQFIRFSAESDGTLFVLDAAKAAQAGPEILAAHRIQSDRSDDLK
jgi:S1-C subfamily serine protease